MTNIKLVESSKMISAECMLFVAEKVLLSRIALSERNTESVINKVNEKVATMCKENVFITIATLLVLIYLVLGWT